MHETLWHLGPGAAAAGMDAGGLGGGSGALAGLGVLLGTPRRGRILGRLDRQPGVPGRTHSAAAAGAGSSAKQSSAVLHRSIVVGCMVLPFA